MTISKKQNTMGTALKGLSILAITIFFAFQPQAGWAKSKMVSKMYAYGLALSLTDSTLYITNITEVDSVWIDVKTGFVINRNDYTAQLDNYLQAVDLKKTMTVVTFGKTRKSIEKKLSLLRKKYAKKKRKNYRIVSIEGFMLQKVDPTSIELQRKTAKIKSKKSKKARREKAKNIANQ